MNEVSVSRNSVLLVEDDNELSQLLSEYLERHGFSVTPAFRIRSAEAIFENQSFEFVLLDVMLPDGEGFEMCKAIRQRKDRKRDVPIIILTARGEDTDRIVGLEIGADDYLAKPFNSRELVARMKAVLRRSRRNGEPTQPARTKLDFGSLQIDSDRRQVLLADVSVELTSRQFDILWTLASRAGRVQSRRQIGEAIGLDFYTEFDRSIDVHISRIRAAIEEDSKQPKYIVSVRGAGYVFRKEQMT